jgi:hypothetical protein
VVINRLTTLIALPPERIERLDRGWVVGLMRLTRPIIRRVMGERRIRRPPVFLSVEEKSGPFAVVAHGLGAHRVAGEALDLLTGEGFDRSATEGVLAHLASPELDPVESALVPFVRETLGYEPAPLQRRARELRDMLTEQELLETIGIASFANAVRRLSLALEAIKCAPR